MKLLMKQKISQFSDKKVKIQLMTAEFCTQRKNDLEILREALKETKSFLNTPFQMPIIE